jgi:hypothetical protein
MPHPNASRDGALKSTDSIRGNLCGPAANQQPRMHGSTTDNALLELFDQHAGELRHDP